MAKITKRLSLDAEAVERAERYAELHSTSLSRLVSDFLSRLPLAESEPNLTPTVRRLLGVAAGDVDEQAYRAYLLEPGSCTGEYVEG